MFGGLFLILKKYIAASALKICKNDEKFFLDTWKKIMIFKLELSHKLFITMYSIPYTRHLTTFQILGHEFVKFFVGILVQTMTTKGQFEINWRLEL